MGDDRQSLVTTLLGELRAGDGSARDRLVALLYDQFHEIAACFMRQEKEAQSLQPTALLHEALIQLLSADVFEQAPNRAYLFGAAARAMRKVLADHARRRTALKRGGDGERLPLDSLLDYYEEQNLDVLHLHDALEELSTVHERASEVVTLRFLGGFTVQEVADQLGISVSTAESDFRFARAWLRQRLRE